MKFRIVAAILALGASAFGSSQKPKITIRFHPEVNPNDGSSMAMPVNLHYARRAAYVARVPAFAEKQIKAIYPFESDDGSWGCFFQLNDQGRIRLETMSTEQLNTAIVMYVGTKMGQHQVIDMLIDKPITSGTITIPRGLTPAEVVVMREQFPVIGETKGKKKKEPELPPQPSDPKDARKAREAELMTNYPKRPGEYVPEERPTTPPPTKQKGRSAPPVPKDKLNELDLPRLRD
jgi:hypothetical protein